MPALELGLESHHRFARQTATMVAITRLQGSMEEVNIHLAAKRTKTNQKNVSVSPEPAAIARRENDGFASGETVA